MADRERDEEQLPPAKRLKTETGAEEKDGSITEQAKEEEPEMDQEEGTEQDGQTTEKNEDPYAFLGYLREEDVGITEYISQHKGVKAVMKQRYSDFVVNEISTDGEVIHLTNTDVPVIVEEAEPSGPVDTVLSEEFLTQLKQVASGSIPNHTASIPVGDDKEKRLHIHRAIKSAFPTLETKTEEKEGQKVITAMMRGKAKDNRKQHEWPDSKRKFPYCRFVLYKENKGSMEAVHLIAKYLKVKDSLFSYAGTKDKRGKTTQEVTAFKVHPQKLQDVNKFLHNITLGNFRYAEQQLRLGELKGNRFSIVLRNVVGEDDDIENNLNSLKTVGFINYYGLQRFGASYVATHQVGRAILKGQWEEAINLILVGNAGDKLPYSKIWLNTKDPKKALGALKSRNYLERVVLRTLLRKPKDYYGAIQSLPRNTRLIYPHSYQSLIFNTMASRRITTFGLKPIVGDLVMPAGVQPDCENLDTEIVDTDSNKQEAEQDPKSKKAPRVKPIPLDETTVSQYTIYDVVMPLPGFDVVYPNNEVHSWYKKQLEEDGLDIDNMQRKQKEYSMPGSYRPVLARPTDIEWKAFCYNDATVPLALSDMDCMKNVEEPQSIEDGKLKALCVTLNLPTSCYATMALREVLKTDTSPAQQASMNVT